MSKPLSERAKKLQEEWGLSHIFTRKLDEALADERERVLVGFKAAAIAKLESRRTTYPVLVDGVERPQEDFQGTCMRISQQDIAALKLSDLTKDLAPSSTEEKV